MWRSKLTKGIFLVIFDNAYNYQKFHKLEIEKSSFLRCRCKNLRKILENTFWRTESKNITCCLLRTKIRGENRKSRNYDTICVKDLFRTIPEKLAGKKLWKKYHLYRNDKSICENNPKFIRRLVFEIFGCGGFIHTNSGKTGWPKLMKKSCLHRNDMSICKNSPKLIWRLVFEIFVFKVKFTMYFKICHILR